MPVTAVCPGSFDPITLGHLDVFARGAAMFDRLVVLIVHNPGKHPSLDLDERAALVRAALDDSGLHRVEVSTLARGLLVDACRERGATVVLKGVRDAQDLAYERPMAYVNHDLAGIETAFVLPRPEHAHLSSSLVRTVASLGGDYGAYVPRRVAESLRAQAWRG